MDPYLETIRTFDSQAIGYQQKYMDVTHYSEGLSALTSILPKDAVVLEAGCGPGNVTRFLLNMRPDLKILATDAAPAMLELARKNNPDAILQQVDAREIHQLSGRFDAIICAFLLPYLSMDDTIKLMKDCYQLLNPGGHLYLSTMEGDYSTSGYRFSSDGKHRCFQYFYPADVLRQLLLDNNYTVRYFSTQAFPPAGLTMATDLIFIATKND